MNVGVLMFISPAHIWHSPDHIFANTWYNGRQVTEVADDIFIQVCTQRTWYRYLLLKRITAMLLGTPKDSCGFYQYFQVDVPSWLLTAKTEDSCSSISNIKRLFPAFCCSRATINSIKKFLPIFKNDYIEAHVMCFILQCYCLLYFWQLYQVLLINVQDFCREKQIFFNNLTIIS